MMGVPTPQVPTLAAAVDTLRSPPRDPVWVEGVSAPSDDPASRIPQQPAARQEYCRKVIGAAVDMVVHMDWLNHANLTDLPTQHHVLAPDAADLVTGYGVTMPPLALSRTHTDDTMRPENATSVAYWIHGERERLGLIEEDPDDNIDVLWARYNGETRTLGWILDDIIASYPVPPRFVVSADGNLRARLVVSADSNRRAMPLVTTTATHVGRPCLCLHSSDPVEQRAQLDLMIRDLNIAAILENLAVTNEELGPGRAGQFLRRAADNAFHLPFARLGRRMPSAQMPAMSWEFPILNDNDVGWQLAHHVRRTATLTAYRLQRIRNPSLLTPNRVESGGTHLCYTDDPLSPGFPWPSHGDAQVSTRVLSDDEDDNDEDYVPPAFGATDSADAAPEPPDGSTLPVSPTMPPPRQTRSATRSATRPPAPTLQRRSIFEFNGPPASSNTDNGDDEDSSDTDTDGAADNVVNTGSNQGSAARNVRSVQDDEGHVATTLAPAANPGPPDAPARAAMVWPNPDPSLYDAQALARINALMLRVHSKLASTPTPAWTQQNGYPEGYTANNAAIMDADTPVSHEVVRGVAGVHLRLLAQALSNGPASSHGGFSGRRLLDPPTVTVMHTCNLPSYANALPARPLPSPDQPLCDNQCPRLGYAKGGRQRRSSTASTSGLENTAGSSAAHMLSCLHTRLTRARFEARSRTLGAPPDKCLGAETVRTSASPATGDSVPPIYRLRACPHDCLHHANGDIGDVRLFCITCGGPSHATCSYPMTRTTRGPDTDEGIPQSVHDTDIMVCCLLCQQSFGDAIQGAFPPIGAYTNGFGSKYSHPLDGTTETSGKCTPTLMTLRFVIGDPDLLPSQAMAIMTRSGGYTALVATALSCGRASRRRAVALYDEMMPRQGPLQPTDAAGLDLLNPAEAAAPGYVQLINFFANDNAALLRLFMGSSRSILRIDAHRCLARHWNEALVETGTSPWLDSTDGVADSTWLTSRALHVLADDRDTTCPDLPAPFRREFLREPPPTRDPVDTLMMHNYRTSPSHVWCSRPGNDARLVGRTSAAGRPPLRFPLWADGVSSYCQEQRRRLVVMRNCAQGDAGRSASATDAAVHMELARNNTGANEPLGDAIIARFFEPSRQRRASKGIYEHTASSSAASTTTALAAASTTTAPADAAVAVNSSRPHNRKDFVAALYDAHPVLRHNGVFDRTLGDDIPQGDLLEWSPHELDRIIAGHLLPNCMHGGVGVEYLGSTSMCGFPAGLCECDAVQKFAPITLPAIMDTIQRLTKSVTSGYASLTCDTAITAEPNANTVESLFTLLQYGQRIPIRTPRRRSSNANSKSPKGKPKAKAKKRKRASRR